MASQRSRKGKGQYLAYRQEGRLQKNKERKAATYARHMEKAREARRVRATA